MDRGSAAEALAQDRYVHLSSTDVARIAGIDSRAEWHALARTWAELERDDFMSDGGRYRFRRHAIFQGYKQELRRLPDEPHFQEQEYNNLNGGIARTFAPVTEDVGRNSLLRSLILAFMSVFDRAPKRPDPVSWKIEMHQFRIKAQGTAQGLPTPEGTHRDGVDWVVTLFVDKDNVSGGSTMLVDAQAGQVARIEMGDPLEAILIDDRKLKHGVTPIAVRDPARTGHRDVLVLTFAQLRSASAPGISGRREVCARRPSAEGDRS